MSPMEEQRRKYVGEMVEHGGLAPADANECFDLAWHAMQEAQKTLVSVTSRAKHPAVSLALAFTFLSGACDEGIELLAKRQIEAMMEELRRHPQQER